MYLWIFILINNIQINDMFKQFEEFMIAYNYTLLKASKYDKIY